jgi:hypothetical protein
MNLFRTFALVVAASLVGCAPDKGVVTGSVDYNGQPVERGEITLTPVDGEGQPVGAPITAGRYEARDVPPGQKRVRIEAFKEVSFAASSQEMMERAQQAKARGDDSGLVDPADIIPPNAEGNDQQLEINAGRNEHNFHLTSPKAKTP